MTRSSRGPLLGSVSCRWPCASPFATASNWRSRAVARLGATNYNPVIMQGKPKVIAELNAALKEELALSRNLIDLKQGWLSRCARFRYTQRFARQRTDQAAGMAGLPSLPA